MADQGSGSRTAFWLRWIARGLGTVVAGFWVLIGLLQAFVGSEPWTAESAILVVLIVAAALAVAVAWWRAGPGGFLLVLVGAALCVFAAVTAGHNRLFAVAITGVPVLLAAALFLASRWFPRTAEVARG